MSQKLKLVKGMSYMGHGIKATKEHPEVTVDELMAKALIKSGFFAEAGISEEAEPEAAISEPEEDSTEEMTEADGEDPAAAIADPLKDMSKAELESYAAEKGIDVSGCNTRAKVMNAIVKATLQAKEARKALKEA